MPVTQNAPAQVASEACLWLARVKLAQGLYDKAISWARKSAAKRAVTRLDAVAIEAQALTLQGHIQQAISLLKAEQTHPDAHLCRVQLGQLLLMTGQSTLAQPILMRLIDDYNSDVISSDDPWKVALVGRAAHLLRSASDANDAFNQAERALRTSNHPFRYHELQILTWRAELFFDKYDMAHASQVTQQILEIAPKHADALALMAHIRFFGYYDFAAAADLANRALQVNPYHAGALFVLGSVALKDFDFTKTRQMVERGLGVNSGDLPLLSLQAAAAFLKGDKIAFEASRKAVLTLNSEYSQMYQILAEFAEWEHRYSELAQIMHQAVQLNPQDGKAWAVLGNNLIRLGNESQGLQALQTSWQYDTFNVRVYNTLNLFEKDIPAFYETVEKGPFRFRFPKSDSQLLVRYVPQVLEEAYRSMVKRYGFEPAKPIGIELYNGPEHFAVRTSGLPSIGIQGVCFGRTLASLSPLAAPFNWANVLWHELGHVFAIQQSNSRVPRWFTEGLSEYETIAKYPDWQRQDDLSLYLAMKRATLPQIKYFNRAFTRANSEEDMTVAYYASSQLLVFLMERYGMQSVNRMLQLWKQNLTDDVVIRRALEVDASELDRQFVAWLKPRLARFDGQFIPDMHLDNTAAQQAKDAPTDVRKQVKWAVLLAKEGKLSRAKEKLSQIIKMYPNHPDALYAQARVQQLSKDFKGATKTYKTMIKAGHDGYFVRIRLAQLANQSQNVSTERDELKQARLFDPLAPQPLRRLYEIAKQSKHENKTLKLLQELSTLQQHDRHIAAELLEYLVNAKMWSQAVKAGKRALYVDMQNPRNHYLYALALKHQKLYDQALYELESALLCNPTSTLKEKIHQQLSAIRHEKTR